MKVLITGPWQEASNNYSCLFDQISVPASLIQPGVLRCYCPGEETGHPPRVRGAPRSAAPRLSLGATWDKSRQYFEPQAPPLGRRGPRTTSITSSVEAHGALSSAERDGDLVAVGRRVKLRKMGANSLENVEPCTRTPKRARHIICYQFQGQDPSAVPVALTFTSLPHHHLLG